MTLFSFFLGFRFTAPASASAHASRFNFVDVRRGKRFASTTHDPRAAHHI
jgi:hypothetical protein